MSSGINKKHKPWELSDGDDFEVVPFDYKKRKNKKMKTNPRGRERTKISQKLLTLKTKPRRERTKASWKLLTLKTNPHLGIVPMTLTC